MDSEATRAIATTPCGLGTAPRLTEPPRHTTLDQHVLMNESERIGVRTDRPRHVGGSRMIR